MAVIDNLRHSLERVGSATLDSDLKTLKDELKVIAKNAAVTNAFFLAKLDHECMRVTNLLKKKTVEAEFWKRMYFEKKVVVKDTTNVQVETK